MFKNGIKIYKATNYLDPEFNEKFKDIFNALLKSKFVNDY